MNTTYVGYVGDQTPNELQVRKLTDALFNLDSDYRGIVLVCSVSRSREVVMIAASLGVQILNSSDFSRCSVILGLPKNKRSRDRIIRKTVWDQLRDFSRQGKTVVVLYHDDSTELREFERP